MERTTSEILQERGVQEIGGNKYQVIGRPYTIRFEGRSEDGFAKLWSCDCPAGAHGRDCKHVRQVMDANDAICDELGYD